MRLIMGAIATAIALGFAAPAGAVASLAEPGVAAAPAKKIIVAQRCRCVERRWNDSCKLRVCRGHW